MHFYQVVSSMATNLWKEFQYETALETVKLDDLEAKKEIMFYCHSILLEDNTYIMLNETMLRSISLSHVDFYQINASTIQKKS